MSRSLSPTGGGALQRVLQVTFGTVVIGYSVALVAESTIWSTNVVDTWAVTDWLTNYAGGFVRRGFVGEMLRVLAADGPAIERVNQIVFASFLLFSLLFFLLVFARTDRTFVWLTCLLLPGAAAAMAIDNAFYYRRELVFHVLLLAAALLSVWSSGRQWHLSAKIRLRVFAVLLAVFVMAPLVHEGFVFLAAPSFLLVYLAMFGTRTIGVKWELAALYAVAAGGFLVAVIWSGGPDTARSIWLSLNGQDRSALGGGASTPLGAINAIGWTIDQGLELPLSVVLSGHWLFWAGALVMCCVIALVVAVELSAGASPGNGSGFFWQAMIAITAGSVPLYALGWDWGRWIVASSIQLVIVTLCTPAPDPRSPADSQVEASFVQAPAFLASRFGSHVAVVVKIAVVIALLTLEVPECCLADHTSPLDAFVALPERTHRLLSGP